MKACQTSCPRLGRVRVPVVLFVSFAVSMLADGSVVKATHDFAERARAPSFRASATTAEQDAPAVEALLSQHGLRNEGFDPGGADGLFGPPPPRAAIRGWQEARGETATGYLDGEQVALLRAAGSPAVAGGVEAAATSLSVTELLPAAAEAAPVTEPPAAAAERVNCEGWNTETFFEMATASVVTACLAAGADIAARDDDDITPLHWAAWSSNGPAVEALLASGANVAARNNNGRTPLDNAAWANENPAVDPAVVEVLVTAGADVSARQASSASGALRSAGRVAL